MLPSKGYLLARPSTNRADLTRCVSHGITIPGRLTAAGTPVSHMLPAATSPRRALAG
ncbi:protein of unknown function [Blastococcus saxobsidens DD2]|uniref:Uncharacterized protein n=1 Tax=Blastococcus saxobsidens (strain DD2) TaxID=1146883 RepID=H6RUA7_BLASD|nr:protein of unknown function [Blastococcus saxobsidens DD2]